MSEKINKAKFFAQYLGQNIAGHECDNCNFRITEISLTDCEVGLWGDWSGGTNPDLSCNDVIGVDAVWLNLRQYTELSNEELLNVSILFGMQESDLFTDQWHHKIYGDLVGCGKEIADRIFNRRWMPSHPIKLQSTLDYLRSIGILLPFTALIDGKPKTYSVEEILALKWAVIAPNK